MKKTVVIILLQILITFMCITNVKAETEYNTLDLTIKDMESSYELSLLLPVEYIQYAIENSENKVTYTGPETLVNNDISTLNIDKNSVKPKLFTQENVQYVEVTMTPYSTNHYQFKVLKNYSKLDIKFKILKTGETQSTIMYLDDFKFDGEGMCRLTYDAKQDTLKSEDYKKASVSWWKIIIGIVIVIIICAIVKLR